MAKEPNRWIDEMSWPPLRPEPIAALSRELLKAAKTIDANRRGDARGARNHRGDGSRFSPSNIRLIAATMVHNCATCGEIVPAALDALLAYLLTKTEPIELQIKATETLGLTPPWTVEKDRALGFEINNPGSTARAVAKAVGVDHKSIIQWRKDPRYKIMRPRSRS